MEEEEVDGGGGGQGGGGAQAAGQENRESVQFTSSRKFHPVVTKSETLPVVVSCHYNLLCTSRLRLRSRERSFKTRNGNWRNCYYCTYRRRK